MVFSHTIYWNIYRKFKTDSNRKRQIASNLKYDSKNEKRYSEKMSFTKLFQTVHMIIWRQTVIRHTHTHIYIYIDLETN